MEEITEAVGNMSVYDAHKKNRIQVSNTKKPLFFYVNLAKVVCISFHVWAWALGGSRINAVLLFV